MAPRYRVTLTVEERAELKALTRAATKTTGKRFLYARALLLCDRGPEGPGWTVARVAEALGVSARTIEHLKRRFVEQGLEFAMERKRRVRPPRKVIFDGAFEARLLALACSPAPPGRKRWTLRLLAEKVVELGWVERVSVMTVQRTLKKPTAASPEEVLADPAPGQRRIRSLHGGRFRSLCPSVRSPASGGLHGRDQQAVDRRSAGAVAGCARPAGAGRA